MLAPIAKQSVSSDLVIAALGGSRSDRYGVCAGSRLCLGGAMLITGLLRPFCVAGSIGRVIHISHTYIAIVFRRR